MTEPFSCIVLHNGLEPYASPVNQESLAVLFGGGTRRPPAGTATGNGPAPEGFPASGRGSPVFLCGACTSVLDVAWELARRECLPPWSTVLAASQSQGRGQLRRLWHSPEGNLHAAFFLPADALFRHEAAALAVGYLVQQALADLNVPARLKWPNDILLHSGGSGAKTGGVLLEERGGTMLAGLGLNLRHSPPAGLLREAHAVPAASLAAWNFSPYPLWVALSASMRARHVTLRRGSVTETLRRAEGVLAWKDLLVQAEDGQDTVKGVIHGLGEQGELLLRDCRGTVRALCSGSIRPVGG